MAVSNAKFETATLCLIKGIVRFEEEATFPPRRRIYIRREEGNGGRKRPLNQRNPKDFYLKLSHLWFFAVFEMVF